MAYRRNLRGVYAYGMTKAPALYGIRQSNHDFSQEAAWGKNTFTNSLPIALAQYLNAERGAGIIEIRAVRGDDGEIETSQAEVALEKIWNAPPEEASFHFERVFDGFRKFGAEGQANQSDVVVLDAEGNHRRGLEVKLVVVPTSSTANNPLETQSCEIVARPPTIEQLAFSIARSFGEARKAEIGDIITGVLGNPMQWKWNDEEFIRDRIPLIAEAAEGIARAGIEDQTPLVLNAIWRTEGQKPTLAENAFDVFSWTDLAFLQLFRESARRRTGTTKVSRPERSLVWLVKCLFDYSVQGHLNFGSTVSEMPFSYQSDKAGSFAGDRTLRHMKGDEFFHPRITRDEIGNLISAEGVGFLAPERRLDATVFWQASLEKQKNPELREMGS